MKGTKDTFIKDLEEYRNSLKTSPTISKVEEFGKEYPELAKEFKKIQDKMYERFITLLIESDKLKK